MNRKIRRAVIGAAVAPLVAPLVIAAAPPSPAGTVLAMEGTAQRKGNAQTAFKNEFCAHHTCRSINNARTPFDVKPGSRQLHAAIQATPGDIILMGYSLGAASIYDRLREWEKNPRTAPDPARVVLVVTYGNPENKFGGDDRKNSYAGLPDTQPYPHLDVTMQYDSVADDPARWGWYSRMNLAFARHMAYFGDVDINDPGNLIYRDEDGTTYMLIPAETLPMLQWMKPFVTTERLAELDAKYRPLIEKDYNRPDYIAQGEGADWGNGTPPPSLAGLEESATDQDSRIFTAGVATDDSVEDPPPVGDDSSSAQGGPSLLDDTGADEEPIDLVSDPEADVHTDTDTAPDAASETESDAGTEAEGDNTDDTDDTDDTDGPGVTTP